MTPICHIESAPRAPGDSPRGKRPRDYGRGRVCALPGCGTILRRTHKGPVCDPCQDNGHYEQRGNMDRKECEAAVLKYLSGRDDWTVSTVIAGDLGVNRNTLMTTLSRMAGEGTLVSRIPAKGGGYRIPATGGVVASSLLKTAPASPPASDAPVIPPPERAAESAPASDPPGNEPRMPVPFAGVDYELVVIGTIVRQIESLTGHETRVRVAAYVASRFL